jgi:lipoprotein-anchoring transpeptidase ErfK/SrfK
MRYIRLFAIASVAALSACRGDGDATPVALEAAELSGVGYQTLSEEELERGRFDTDWRRVVQLDTLGLADDDSMNPESWEDISPSSVNSGATHLPLHGDVSGPSVLTIQVLLDRAFFSPGIIDGRWGKNTEKALYYFQQSNALSATGRVDSPTVDALLRVTGDEQVRTHRLTDQDVEGPFVQVPEDIYERAELECLCYESLREKLGEVFHSSPALLEQLNPGLDLNALAAGDALSVPAVEPFRVAALPEGEYTGGREVRRIVVSGGGHYVHALNAAGDILYHFPSTLGAEYSPDPGDDYTVEAIVFHPDWHYQPRLLRDVDPNDEEAVIPAGPNNDVGIVWMALSEPHYGIHGTKAPETIGYAVSSGCVRLTNWDAAILARRVPPGTRVEFTDVQGR